MITNLLRKSTIDFHQLQKLLNKHQSRGTLPSMNDWPDRISLTSDVWGHIKKIREYTTKENRERSISLFWADGDAVATEYVRGKETRVSSSHKVTLKYKPTHRENWYEKIIYLDGDVYKKYTVAKDKIPKKPEVNFLFNIHTHPKRKTETGEYYFNHLSLTDLNSLYRSDAICSGLVLDKFWLICKTNQSKSPEIIKQDLESIADKFTLQENTKREELSRILRGAGYVIYHAKMDGRLVKLR